jgi:hypothetical protein
MSNVGSVFDYDRTARADVDLPRYEDQRFSAQYDQAVAQRMGQYDVPPAIPAVEQFQKAALAGLYVEERRLGLGDVMERRPSEEKAAIQARANELIAEEHARRALSSDSARRKATPMARGLLDYFPDALAEVARLSQAANDKHNPGEPMHWSKDKSNDHADCVVRHLIDRGQMDEDGFLHDVKVAWRALAMLQVALEARS